MESSLQTLYDKCKYEVRHEEGTDGLSSNRIHKCEFNIYECEYVNPLELPRKIEFMGRKTIDR